MARRVMVSAIDTSAYGGQLSTAGRREVSRNRARVYIELPVSSSDFRSLRIQAQPPAPCSKNLLATIPAMIGAPSSSWITVSLEVIGLVKDHRARTPAEAARPMIYLPYQQRYQAVLTLVVRTDGEAAGKVAAIRDAARSLDPAVAPYNIRTLAAEKGRSLAGARRTTEISSVFGLLCLIVSAVGLYGVLAQAVALRAREIAIRMALGAARTRTMGLVPRRCDDAGGPRPCPRTRRRGRSGPSLEQHAVRIRDADLPTMAAATTLLCVVALAAAWRPAHRAARVDPMVALRVE